MSEKHDDGKGSKGGVIQPLSIDKALIKQCNITAKMYGGEFNRIIEQSNKIVSPLNKIMEPINKIMGNNLYGDLGLGSAWGGYYKGFGLGDTFAQLRDSANRINDTVQAYYQRESEALRLRATPIMTVWEVCLMLMPPDSHGREDRRGLRKAVFYAIHHWGMSVHGLPDGVQFHDLWSLPVEKKTGVRINVDDLSNAIIKEGSVSVDYLCLVEKWREYIQVHKAGRVPLIEKESEGNKRGREKRETSLLVIRGYEIFTEKRGFSPTGRQLFNAVAELLPEWCIVCDDTVAEKSAIRWNGGYCTEDTFMRSFRRNIKNGQ